MVPFVDLKQQYLEIKDELDSAVLNVLGSTQYVLGNEVAEFEKEFAAYTQAGYGIAVNSGTSALHLALLAAGIGPGDEVITVPNTFIATVAAIRYTGAKPVFVDVDRNSFNMDVSKIEQAVTKKTKALLPVHLYGQTADMDPIMEIAAKHKLIVIEDAAQAHGAEYKGKRVGSIGDLGGFSFYPGKNLGACGEGGIIVCNSPEYTKNIRMLRDWGAEKKYHHQLQGFNYRMEGIQGAALRIKLRHLEKWTEARRANAAVYNNLLKGCGVVTPVEMPYARHVYHLYEIRVPARDELQKALQNENIQSGLHYPVPVHLQPAHADLGYKKGDFPVTEEMASQILSLPMHPHLSEEQLKKVADAVKTFMEK